jgi:hypothetical protein
LRGEGISRNNNNNNTHQQIELSAIESVNECESVEGMPDFEVVIMDRAYVLRAETIDEMREWIETIINAVNTVTNRKVFPEKQKTQKSMRRLSVKPSILKQGWLEKRGEKGLKLWSSRYFILQIVSPTITLLKYYPGPDSSTPNGQIGLLFSSQFIIRNAYNKCIIIIIIIIIISICNNKIIRT